MGKQLRAQRVYQTLTQEMANKVMPAYRVQEPPWYKVLGAVSPSELFTRPIPVQHAPPNTRARKPKNIYKPQKIVYEEDELRSRFYRDHPWELARPRIILELDGKDAMRCDWSKGVRQPGIALSGECAVQRQLWLMHNEGMSKDRAYDVARREFYALRQEEEIEKRVAREEARYVGAYFGKNRLDISQVLEGKEFETWKKWAAQEVAALERNRNTQYAHFGEEDDPADAGVEVEDAEMAEFSR
ncbi:mitochondrial ribosomal protein [Sodiomyces alkalinus F11]|uniref:37S ribosomal protein S25, mitochondrial n=1 Tax=Sodiomyces alkalinus (strain CBS 110278 / VKM F-3762 / F11) TaxID=1314773 RepID=A0A3N2PL14_SODAK|nr:mitochondrial ribosomal protein [Sodiomyces alkalinus F11]ROT35218.1 mitochondrial ribosomal protein [Sodiomyces alkalinus F11]